MICRHCGKNPEYTPDEYSKVEEWYKLWDRTIKNRLDKHEAKKDSDESETI